MVVSSVAGRRVRSGVPANRSTAPPARCAGNFGPESQRRAEAQVPGRWAGSAGQRSSARDPNGWGWTCVPTGD